MSGIKFCGGKTTILVFTHIALGFKILGHISENVQKGCHKAFRQPWPLSTQPQYNNIFGFFFFLNLDFSLNLDPSKLYEKPKVLQNIGVQRALAAGVRHIQYLGSVKLRGELNFLSITIVLLGSFQQLVPKCNLEYLVQRIAVFLRELWEIFCKCFISVEIVCQSFTGQNTELKIEVGQSLALE